MPAPAPRTASSSSSGHRATTTSSRLAPSTASNRMDQSAEDEEWDTPEGSAKESKIPRKTSAPTTKKAPTKSTSSTKKSTSAMELESEEDDPPSSSSARIAALEAKVNRIREERDSYLSQFSELKAIRSTAVETELASYKKAAEARFRHSEDLVKSYKVSLDRAEKRLRGEIGVTGDEEREREEENERLRKEVESLKREKKKVDEEARRLALELRTEVESSRALLSNSKNANGSASFNRDGDNQAVRRLYEDLTGIVISRIEMCPQEDGDDINGERRRYTGAYAAVGHHDLQLSIEESTSTLPSSTSARSASKVHELRKDLVFRPHLDPQRDSELLASSNLPEYLREEIRFDRGLSVKFLGTLEKGLKK